MALSFTTLNAPAALGKVLEAHRAAIEAAEGPDKQKAVGLCGKAMGDVLKGMMDTYNAEEGAFIAAVTEHHAAGKALAARAEAALAAMEKADSFDPEAAEEMAKSVAVLKGFAAAIKDGRGELAKHQGMRNEMVGNTAGAVALIGQKSYDLLFAYYTGKRKPMIEALKAVKDKEVKVGEFAARIQSSIARAEALQKRLGQAFAAISGALEAARTSREALNEDLGDVLKGQSFRNCADFADAVKARKPMGAKDLKGAADRVGALGKLATSLKARFKTYSIECGNLEKIAGRYSDDGLTAAVKGEVKHLALVTVRMDQLLREAERFRGALEAAKKAA